MKRRILALLLALTVLCTLAACEETPDAVPAAPDAEELARWRAEYEALEERYAALEAEYEEYRAACEAFQEERLALLRLLDYHVIERDELTGAMFAPDAVEAHGLPLAESAVIGTCRNMLVDVILTVQNGEDLWSLVHLLNLAENMDTVGWVLWDELTPYDPSVMEELLTYPVRVKRGTVLRDEVRGNEWVSDGTSSYLVAYTETEAVTVHESGGISYRVTRADLVYPSVRDGEIVWEPSAP